MQKTARFTPDVLVWHDRALIRPSEWWLDTFLPGSHEREPQHQWKIHQRSQSPIAAVQPKTPVEIGQKMTEAKQS